MSTKIVEGFFNELINIRDNHELSVSIILDIIEKSTFSKETKDELKKRINSHKHCEREFLEDEDNEEGSSPFVVVNYGGVNTALECECCYNVIIDDEILEMMN